MLKKRIIFTLLYDGNGFVLSRNFRLQRVGDINWLKRNYDFSHISYFIDELVVLDVSRDQRNLDAFCNTLKIVSSGCFVPIASGGGIRSLDDARQLLRSGADKVVVNSALFDDEELVGELAQEFGRQCIVGSVDVKRGTAGSYGVFTANGSRQIEANAQDALSNISNKPIGELYLNSMDRDGTGQGYDFDTLKLLQAGSAIPVVLAGGVGNGAHLKEGLEDPRVDAVATANLFNFVGDGLQRARSGLIENGALLAFWPHISEISLGPMQKKSRG